jgi:hypothetical protein
MQNSGIVQLGHMLLVSINFYHFVWGGVMPPSQLTARTAALTAQTAVVKDNLSVGGNLCSFFPIHCCVGHLNPANLRARIKTHPCKIVIHQHCIYNFNIEERLENL